MKKMKIILGLGLLGLLLSSCTTGGGETNPPEPAHEHTIDQNKWISNDKFEMHPFTCEHKEDVEKDFESWPNITLRELYNKWNISVSYTNNRESSWRAGELFTHDYYINRYYRDGLTPEMACDDDIHTNSISWTKIVEPSDTEDGYKEATCSICGHTIHTVFKNNIERSNDSFTYILNDDNESYSVLISKRVEGRLIVPSEYNGKPVTIVKSEYDKAEPHPNNSSLLIYPYRDLVDNNGLKEVVIPESIKIVEPYAFGQVRDRSIVYDEYGNKMERPLETVYWNAINGATQGFVCENIVFGDNVKSIKSLGTKSSLESAFEFYKSVTLNNGLVRIENNSFAFKRYFYLKEDANLEIIIPDSVTYLGEKSFILYGKNQNKTNFKIKIGNGVSDIGPETFYMRGDSNGGGTVEITFGANIKNVEANAFLIESSYIIKVIVEGDDLIFENGLLGGDLVDIQEKTKYQVYYTHDGPFGKKDISNFELNEFDNAYYIGDKTNGFKYLVKSKNKQIVDCDVHQSCISIESEAFYGCSSLQSISIHGSSLKRVGEYAFEGCESLNKNVEYQGFSCIQDSTDYNGTIILFENNNSLNEIDLSSANAVLYDCSLKDCSNLVKITLGNSINNIPRSCFENCVNLEEVKYPTHSPIRGIGDRAFHGCKKLKCFYTDIGQHFDGEIVIPENVEKIQDSAFYNCDLITNVDLNDKLLEIECNAFYGTSILGIIFPKTIKYIKYGSLSGIFTLETIYVDGENTNYYSKDGLLYAYYSSGRPYLYVVPWLVKGIVELDDCVEVFGENFNGHQNPNLTGLIIPKSVKTINSSLYNLISLSYLEYLGTIAEWNEIYLYEGFGRAFPAEVVHCTDGDVNL